MGYLDDVPPAAAAEPAAPAPDENFGRLVGAIRSRESGGNPEAVGPPTNARGERARGSMQIMPATFAQYAQPGEDYNNDEHRTAAALRKLQDDYHFYGGDTRKTAAAYIGGRGAVDADGNIVDHRADGSLITDGAGSTRSGYAQQVLARMGQASPNRSWLQDVPNAPPATSTWLHDVPAAPPPKRDRTWGEAVSDTGRALAGGVGSIIEGAGTVGGLIGNRPDNPARRFGKDMQEYWEEGKSEPLKAMQADRAKRIASVPGEFSKFGVAVEDTVRHPALAVDALASNVASMIPGGLVARGVGLAGKAAELAPAMVGRLATGAAVLTNAGTQGAQVASQTLDDFKALPQTKWEANPDYQQYIREGYDPNEAKNKITLRAVKQAGGEGGLLTLAMNAFPAGRAIERMAAGTAERGGKSALRSAAGGALAEGLGETVEEGGGQVAQNVAVQQVDPSRPTFQGVGEQSAMGGLAGAGFGAAAGAAAPVENHTYATTPQPAAVTPPQSTQNSAVTAAPPPQAPEEPVAVGTPPQPETPGFAVPPPPDTRRADLEAVLDDPRPLDQIRADQAQREQAAEAQAHQARQQELQQWADAAGLPRPGTGMLFDLPEGGQGAGAVESVDLDTSGPLVRVMDADGVLHDLRPGESNLRVAPEGDGSRAAPVVATDASHVDLAATTVDTGATPAQKLADNYRKAWFKFEPSNPLSALGRIAIETPKGGERTAADGSWAVPNMPSHYGHLDGVKGADGDMADVFIGPDINSRRAYIVDQIDHNTGRFDETKSFVGFDTMGDALEAYNGSFSDGKGPDRVGDISKVSVQQFIALAKSDRLKVPYSYKEPNRASTVPGNAGQVRSGGPEPEGRQEQSRPDLQRPAQAGDAPGDGARTGATVGNGAGRAQGQPVHADNGPVKSKKQIGQEASERFKRTLQEQKPNRHRSLYDAVERKGQLDDLSLATALDEAVKSGTPAQVKALAEESARRGHNFTEAEERQIARIMQAIEKSPAAFEATEAIAGAAPTNRDIFLNSKVLEINRNAEPAPKENDRSGARPPADAAGASPAEAPGQQADRAGGEHETPVGRAGTADAGPVGAEGVREGIEPRTGIRARFTGPQGLSEKSAQKALVRLRGERPSLDWAIEPAPTPEFETGRKMVVGYAKAAAEAQGRRSDAIISAPKLEAQAMRDSLAKAFGGEGIKRLEDSGRLWIGRSDEAPKSLQDQMDDRTWQAAYYDGRAYIFTDNAIPKKAPALLLHELGEHHGLKEMLGDDTYTRLIAQVKQMARSGAPAVRQAWAEVAKNYPGLKVGSDQFMAEVIAHAGENQDVQKMTWWRELLDRIRAWLVKQGFTRVESDADVQMLLRASLARVMREAGQTAVEITGEPAFASTPAEPKAAMASAAGTIRDTVDTIRSDAAQRGVMKTLGDIFESDKKFNLWHRTIGTQFHKAQVDKDFGRVFNAVNQQINDTSKFAMEAEQHAPNILQRLGGIKDVGKAMVQGSNRHVADMKAVSKAIFANIEGESGVQQHVHTDAELRADFKLTDRQIQLYHEFRAAVDSSLDRMAQSMAMKMASPFIDPSALKNRSLEDTVSEIDAMLKLRSDTLAGELKGFESGKIGKPDIVRTLQTDDKGNFRQDYRVPETDEALTTSLQSRINAIENARTKIEEMQEYSGELKQKGYSPAMRFGRYAVMMGDAADPKFFSLYETQTEANLAAMKLRRENPNETVSKNVLNDEAWKMFAGISPETVELFARFAGIEEETAYKNYIALATSSRSAMKRMLERKGVEGFSWDATRVLAQFITSNARQSAINASGTEITDAVAAIPKEKGDVQKEAQRLVDYVRNPREEAAKLRGLLFAHYMGGSIASAITNLTQPVLQTAPYLSQYIGGAKLTQIMTRAARDAVGGKITDPGMRAALQKAAAEGITEPHEIHSLMADAQGSAFGNSLRGRAFAKAWGGFFAISEAFNRRLTFMAAYDVAREAGRADAYEFAAKAVHETQGIYNKANRPNWARGAVGATLFTFKQFSISYLEFIARLPTKQKLIALAVLIAAAGLQGLPFADDLEDLIDTIGQRMGYATNSRKALRQAVAGLLGDGLGDVLLHGISSIPGMPLDVSSRMGMSNLIPATNLLNPSNTDKSRDVLELFGAAGGIAKSAADAASGSGNLVDTIPLALRNLYKGISMLNSGQYSDSKGRLVSKTDTVDAVSKMLGFQPAGVAADSRRIGEEIGDVNIAKRIKGEIAGEWARALYENDSPALKAARERLAKWNKDNPDLPVAIKGSQIQARVKEMKLTRDQRFAKTMSPEMRRQIIREAAQ